MTKKITFTDLREQAEKLLGQRGGGQFQEDAKIDLLELVQELEIYQIELELQNEQLKQTQKELEDSRDEYLSLYDSAPNAYVTLDSKGLITRFNLTAKMMFDPGRLLMGKAFVNHIYPEDLSKYFSCLKKVGYGEKTYCELRIFRKDGTVAYVHMEAIAGADAKNGSWSWNFAFIDITERKQAEKALRQLNRTLEQKVAERTRLAESRAEQLSALASQLTIAEQRERRRIANLLHDDLQQLLVGAKINSEVLSGQIGTEHKQVVTNIQDLINQSIQVSRSLSAELSPPVLQQGGLSAGLAWLANWMHEKHGLAVELEIDPGLDPEREDITVLLFQSIRELLLNVVKHAGVKSARIETARDQDRLRVTVMDQGGGFDPDIILEKIHNGSHFGLLCIRERLTLLGGGLEIEGEPGKGAVFSLVVPLEITIGNL
jgi:PAS domain S-box-containing protein